MSDITLVWEEKLNQLPFVFIYCYIVGKKTLNDISVLGLTFFLNFFIYYYLFMGILGLTRKDNGYEPQLSNIDWAGTRQIQWTAVWVEPWVN